MLHIFPAIFCGLLLILSIFYIRDYKLEKNFNTTADRFVVRGFPLKSFFVTVALVVVFSCIMLFYNIFAQEKDYFIEILINAGSGSLAGVLCFISFINLRDRLVVYEDKFTYRPPLSKIKHCAFADIKKAEVKTGSIVVYSDKKKFSITLMLYAPNTDNGYNKFLQRLKELNKTMIWANERLETLRFITAKEEIQSKDTLKIKHNKAFKIVKKHIDGLDPMGLLGMSCPPDEYDVETAKILPTAMNTPSADELADFLIKFFDNACNEQFLTDKPKAIETAARILNELHSLTGAVDGKNNSQP